MVHVVMWGPADRNRRPFGLRLTPGRLALTVFRLPLKAYTHDAGWIFGRVFLQFTHTGRKSGKRYDAVAMVLRYDEATREAVICAAWGPATDWYRNLKARPAPRVRLGKESFPPQHRFLTDDEAFEVARHFRRHHPHRLRLIASILGWGDLREDSVTRQFVHDHPFVAFRPEAPADEIDRRAGADSSYRPGRRSPLGRARGRRSRLIDIRTGRREAEAYPVVDLPGIAGAHARRSPHWTQPQQRGGSDMDRNLVDQVIDTAARVAASGAIGANMHGNVSIRPPGADEMYFTAGPSMREHPGELVVRVGLDGVLREGTLPPIQGAVVDMHIARYVDEPTIGCVVHTHAPFATAFATANRPIGCWIEALAMFGLESGVPLAGYGPRGSQQAVALIREALAPGVPAVLLANHGVLVFHRTPELAILVNGVVEEAAAAGYRARALGGPVELPLDMRAAALQRAMTFADAGTQHA